MTGCSLLMVRGSFFEDKPVSEGACIDDLDIEFVEEYTRKIGYRKSVQEFLVQNRGFVKLRDGENAGQHSGGSVIWQETAGLFPARGL